MAPCGIGVAKLKFRDVPDDLQKQYGCDPKVAAEFETKQAQASEQLRAQMVASDSLTRYRDLALLHQSLAGLDNVSYSVSVDANGKVTAQGTTGTAPSVTVTNVNMPAFVGFPYRNGLFTDYLPMQVPPSAVVLTN